MIHETTRKSFVGTAGNGGVKRNPAAGFEKSRVVAQPPVIPKQISRNCGGQSSRAPESRSNFRRTSFSTTLTGLNCAGRAASKFGGLLEPWAFHVWRSHMILGCSFRRACTIERQSYHQRGLLVDLFFWNGFNLSEAYFRLYQHRYYLEYALICSVSALFTLCKIQHFRFACGYI